MKRKMSVIMSSGVHAAETGTDDTVSLNSDLKMHNQIRKFIKMNKKKMRESNRRQMQLVHQLNDVTQPYYGSYNMAL